MLVSLILKCIKYNVLLIALSLTLISCSEDKATGSTVSLVTTSDISGIWRRTDVGHEHKGKEYLPNGTGYLGNFNDGPFVRAGEFTWSLNSSQTMTTSIEFRLFNSATYNEDITEFSGTSMTQRRQEDGIDRHWQLFVEP